MPTRPAKTPDEAAERPQERPETSPVDEETAAPLDAPRGPEDRLRALVAEEVREQIENGGRERWPLSVGEAIAEVTRRVGAIEKAHTSEAGDRYRYRGIDDVLAALHPLLGDVGLVIMPGRIADHRRETRLTANNKTLNVALVTVQYRLIGPDGTETTGEATGEAHDSGDKATQKALSQAYKSFTLQLFCIPTESSADDEPDRTNEPGRPFTAEEVQRANHAALALESDETVEKLAATRRRALALLDVPVTLEDGSVAPLASLFDRKLASLDRSAPGGEPR